MMTDDARKSAIAAWNTRAALEAAGVAELREENKALRKALAYAKEYLAGTYETGAIAEIQKIERAALNPRQNEEEGE